MAVQVFDNQAYSCTQCFNSIYLYQQVKQHIADKLQSELGFAVETDQVSFLSDVITEKLFCEFHLISADTSKGKWTQAQNRTNLSQEFETLVLSVFTLLSECWSVKSDQLYAVTVRLLTELVFTFQLAPRPRL